MSAPHVAVPSAFAEAPQEYTTSGIQEIASDERIDRTTGEQV